jgi:predicted  nucleic acid-binding Zn-ribbon protein
MKKCVACFVFCVSFIYCFSNQSLFAQTERTVSGLEQSIRSIESKIATLEKKMDQVLVNQEKMFEEFKILKIRIKRS